MRQTRTARRPSGGSFLGDRGTDPLTRFLVAVAILGVLILLLAVIGWGSAPAFGSGREDATGPRFRAGMEALNAAHAIADREARYEKLDEAIANFRAILVNRPELVRVRLELARAFFMKEEDTLARRHFEQVLAGKPPPAVAGNIQSFLNVMRARRRWDAWFGAALAPDSNLNTGSGDRTIWLDTPFGRLPFTLDRDVSPKSGLGLSFWGGGEYQYPLSDRLRLRSGANASAREYKGRDFDRHSVSVYLGPRRLIDARTEASLLATVDRQRTAGMPETDRFGVRMEAERRVTPRLALSVRASAARRNCRDCNHLDGPEGDVSLGATWVALPTLRVGGNAGWNWTRANSEHWRSRGPQASLGATLALPAGFTVGLRASMQRTEYQGSGSVHHTMDGKPRKDRTRTLSVSVHNRAVTVLGFSPRLSLVNETRDTNAQTLDYSRNRAELSFVRQF